MTDEQIIIAIAEVCGWREAFPGHGEPHPETKRGGILLPYNWVNEITHARKQDLPDYLNDLNAMHEAEMLLDDLSWVIPGTVLKGSASLYDAYSGELSTRFGRSIRATAIQRAEAFLRTLGKWIEP